MFRGEKILVAGPTGQVGGPLAMALARENEVWGVARFGDARAKARLEAAGVRCVVADLASGDLAKLPDDFSYALNFSVAKTHDWDRDLAANAEGTGFLMHHCRRARAFLHCSSTAVYAPNGHERLRETSPLGDNHAAFGFLPTYSICKIAAEGIARFAARQFGLPTLIARLNVPYGDSGGWPAVHLELLRAGKPIAVHENAPSLFNPIHEDDLLAGLPRLLAAASAPATIVNWGGSEAASIEDWCAWLGELTGLEPVFAPTRRTIESACIDTTRMEALTGPTQVPWREGFRRMVAARRPELLRASVVP